MIFNSLEFLVFFPIVTLLYFLLPHRMRWPLLLAASCFFYMAFVPVYILILALTIVVDYAAGIGIERSQGMRRKVILWASLIVTALILFVFKYFDFFAWNANHLAKLIGWNYSVGTLAILLPIGLSFHTFQSMSYVIEVYRGAQKAERHFGIYALYVMFYPQLVAGPIERPQNLLHQFHAPHRFDYGDVTAGLRMMAVGFFKKIVIADNLSPLVNNAYADPAQQSAAALLVATVFFAFQIYCDFSGYSSIAIGTARVMGFRLMTNFRRPYLASSVAEFWTRWHISLSTWFKDYLYIPLGGSRVGRLRHLANLMAVFLVSGIWHGANWTFIIWGALHGSYLIAEQWTSGLRAHGRRAFGSGPARVIPAVLGPLYVFALVTLGWVFFRAKTVPDALHICSRLPAGFLEIARNLAHPAALRDLLGGLGMDATRFAFCAGLIVALIAVEAVEEKTDVNAFILNRPVWQRWALYYACLLLLIFGSSLNSQQSFIYFQF
jgi:D-alanyl-lipoteichoic acid acyltransferase DltB (MBOAT superfamily)